MCGAGAVWPREEKSAGVLSQEKPQICIRGPGFFPERPSAIERFERRVQEIARAAEVTRRFFVKDSAGLFSFVQPRLPEIGNRGPVPGPNAGEVTGRHRRRVRVKQQPRTLSPETRDSVPFGLKRRVAVGFPVFGDQERRSPVDLPVAGERRSRDRGVRVLGRPRETQNRPLRDEEQLGQIRRAIKQAALDLLAEMMEIEAGLQERPDGAFSQGVCARAEG